MQGKVFRIEKNKNYTVISNYHLKDKNLSLKAKGLLSLMLSLPDDWDYSISGLVAICKEELRAVKSTLEELKEFGYLKVIKTPPQAGKNYFTYEYIIYEMPQEEKLQNVDIQNVPLQNVDIQNAIQLNTNKLNTNKLNTNNKNNNMSDFLEFYKIYPRKEAKQNALKAYNKAIKQVDKNILLKGLKNYKKYIEENKIEKRYIRQPASWLNGGCWEDEYSIQKEDKSKLLDILKEMKD